MLESVRVLEVSHAVAGPTTAQILSDYGAEIIKIERPGSGDIFRDVPGMGPTMFLAVNRGKKCVAIDLKTSKGLTLFYDLVTKCDVIIENLGPGVADSLGISYKRIKKTNSKIIYCKIESFGSGPYEKTPAFDPVLQAATGIMSTTGFPPDKYVRAGISLVDMSTGLQAACGILALLLGRKESGEGAELKVSLYDAALYFMSYWVAMYDLYGRDTTPLGSGHFFGAPYNLFKTVDGHVYIAIANDKSWESFCRALSFGDLFGDKRFILGKDRVRNKHQLEKSVAKRVSKFTTKEIASLLKDTGVPFGKFNSISSLLKDPHFLGRDILKEYTYEKKKYRTIVNPSLINGKRPFAKKSPAEIGKDTESVLKDLLRIKQGELNKLKRDGIIA
jgi:crotonobetainyl-CoA:carnitine CoA-transferase CaiB-like acyl-CoA transferase